MNRFKKIPNPGDYTIYESYSDEYNHYLQLVQGKTLEYLLSNEEIPKINRKSTLILYLIDNYVPTIQEYIEEVAPEYVGWVRDLEVSILNNFVKQEGPELVTRFKEDQDFIKGDKALEINIRARIMYAFGIMDVVSVREDKKLLGELEKSSEEKTDEALNFLKEQLSKLL